MIFAAGVYAGANHYPKISRKVKLAWRIYTKEVRSDWADTVPGWTDRSTLKRVSCTAQSSIPLESFATLELDGWREGVDKPLVYVEGEGCRDYVAMSAAFLFEDSTFSVILLNGKGEYVHRWPIPDELFHTKEDFLQPASPSDFVILDDGSLITFIGNRDYLFRIGFDGEVIWRVPGRFHHFMCEDGESLWILGAAGEITDNQVRAAWNHYGVINQVNLEDGSVTRTISYWDIMKTNLDEHDLFVFERAKEARTRAGALGDDIWHPNDVEVLPAEYASAFPMFEAGDILSYMRNINLLFVFDPESLRVKWWCYGMGQGAHDPDWRPDGTIVFFNNRNWGNAGTNTARHNYNAVMSVDPSTKEVTSILEGIDYNLHTPYVGTQDINDRGDMLIAAAQQGRAVVIDAEGEILLDFVNRQKDDTALWVFSARFVSPEDWDRWNRSR